MKRLLALLSIFLVVFFASCGNDINMEKINSLESMMLDENGMLRNDVGLQLVDAYILYVEKNSEDENAPNILFKALDLSVNLQSDDYSKSIEIADMMVEKYPNHEMSPMALYLKAFIYEELMRDNENAEKAYKEFLEKYPDNPMAEEVRFAMKNIGIPTLELIRQFENESQNR